MRYRILIILLFVSTITYATPQVMDMLIVNGDTLYIEQVPLEYYNEIDSIRSQLFEPSKDELMSTACWREYQAEWIIEENVLYLNNVYSYPYSADSLKANLERIFKSRCKQGKVKAYWYSGQLTAPQGELLFCLDLGHGGFYKKQLGIEISEGNVVSQTQYDNSKSKRSIYSTNNDSIKTFIYGNIDWNILPKTDTIVKVYVQFSANEKGIIDSIKIARGYSAEFDKEAMRVVQSIPSWDIYYRLGKPVRIGWTMPIIFSEENRDKYKNR